MIEWKYLSYSNQQHTFKIMLNTHWWVRLLAIMYINVNMCKVYFLLIYYVYKEDFENCEIIKENKQ